MLTLALMLGTMASAVTPSISPRSHCTAVDGDTLRCAPTRLSPRGELVRLLGIDAPEKNGRCRRGRICAPGDWRASRASLSAFVRSGSPVILRVGTDRYGRTLAMVSVNGADLSCWQLTRGHAIYKQQWDDGARVKRSCPAA